jgi:hypothetical protein
VDDLFDSLAVRETGSHGQRDVQKQTCVSDRSFPDLRDSTDRVAQAQALLIPDGLAPSGKRSQYACQSKTLSSFETIDE